MLHKIILIFSMIFFIFIGILPAQKPDEQTADTSSLSLQELLTTFPSGRYTPHGYIDNPYHSMVLNRSGVIRSVPPLGFGFWQRQFQGSYAEGPRDYLNYLSLLQVSIRMDDINLIHSDDFKRHNIDLYSGYHTKNVMSYDWNFRNINFSLAYFLADENSLVCRVSLENTDSREKTVELAATNIYGLWEIKWWGSNGLTSRYVDDQGVNVSKIWAYGDIFAVGSDWTPDSYQVFFSAEEWKTWVENPKKISAGKEIFRKGRGPVHSSQSFKIVLPAAGEEIGYIYLCRGKNEKDAISRLQYLKTTAADIMQTWLNEDQQFWSACPRLQGDWPENWKHGWVYDWETIRMNVRKPVGIFKHPWDAMQVHSPRLVLGETALDMLTLSYADPALAKTVLYGTFADAIAPNIPCVREDGSVNMIGADGSECGTAPMWGFPFHVIRTIYASTGDSAWIRLMYPYLKSYIEWWLENRTDDEGWFHCNNSWESGQDGSRRFLVEGEGDPATFVRTVDVEASMAEAMRNMAVFAELAGFDDDIRYWSGLFSRRIENTQSMFLDGWFRDIDGRNGKPIIFEDFYDPIMLAPLSCDVATSRQIAAIRPKIKFIAENPKWLQWPPGVMAFTEAAWTAGENLSAALAVKNIADRIYARTDSHTIMFDSHPDSFAYRIPGIANEFWPLEFRPPGAENYGWGAILPAFIIRNIIGFRERTAPFQFSFFLAPALTEDLLQKNRVYEISNLKYRGQIFNLTYKVLENSNIRISLHFYPETRFQLEVGDEEGNRLATTSGKDNKPLLKFVAKNGKKYIVREVK
ncbi:MAG: hypothetical protein EH225_02950 [Calditrichaeota bacterium]|nr:MAG: hypothetical protein EH225_02950 [Calditrichota bacterium]